jgi:hypothetical protein
MVNDNGLKISTVLQVISTLLLGVLAYMWQGNETEHREIKSKLRAVELNTIKLLTISGAAPVAAYEIPWPQPGAPITVELVITETANGPAVTQAAKMQGGPLRTDGPAVLRNPGAF